MPAIEESVLYQTIHRQPADWRELLARDPAPLEAVARQLGAARRVLLAGIGTSFHAAQLGAFLLRAAGRPAWAVQSADLASYPFGLGPGDALVVISHRGTKGYSVQALARGREAGAWCLALTGQGAPMQGDATLQTVAPERSSTFTASYTAALLLLAQLAARLGAPLALEALPALAEEVLAGQAQVRAWAHAAARAPRLVFSGGGLNGWTALEGALKVKEAAYLTAEGMALETLLHGPIVGLNRGDRLILIRVPGPFAQRAAEIAGVAREIGLELLWVGTPPADAREEALRLPELPEPLSPLLATLPLQLLACFLAEARGTNPDSFRMDVAEYGRAIK